MIFAASNALATPVKDVSIWITKDAAPGPKIKMTINTRNVPVVHVAAYKLSSDWLLSRRDATKVRPSTPESPARKWDVTVTNNTESPNNAQGDRYRSRQVNLPSLDPGVYLIEASGDGKSARALVNITNLTIVCKRSTKQLLAWVCDVTTGNTIEGAKVALYGRDRSVIKSGITDRDGICVLMAVPGVGDKILVTRRNEAAVVPCGVAKPDGEITAHFQTDRPIYRPGQTVFFKVILRRTKGRLYTPVSNTDCHVEVRDSKDNVVSEKKIATNDIGTLSGQTDLPSEGVLGPYSIVVTVGKKKVYQTFSVAEYRKPEFKVDVKPVESRYMAGDTASIAVNANYYFGAPVAQAEVKYSIRRVENLFGDFDKSNEWYSSDDGNLYPHDTYDESPFVDEGTIYTDEAGKVSIPIKTDKSAPDSTYTIECTVKDSSNRQVEASGSIPVYRSAVRLGIRTDIIFAPLGSNIPVQITATDLDGKPVSAAVTLSIKKTVWVEKDHRNKYETLSSTTVSVPPSGKASAKIPAKSEGDLLISAVTTDRTGRKASAEMSVWIVNSQAKSVREEKEPSIGIKLDRHIYTPGNTVKAWITTNIAKRPMLITAEGGDIWQHTVVRPGKGGFAWTLKTDIEMSPNAYIEAAQWSSNDLVSGNSIVRIQDQTRKLSVSVKPERDAYKPGETASYIVDTRGNDGKPVSAEVAVSVIDEAIYALRPDNTADAYKLFWGTRENRVTTRFSAPEELSGGAYQRVNTLAPVRQRFVDTAYWNANVTTGADGTARVSVELPGNLTTWRATARAVTQDTRVGVGTASIKSARPVMLRLATPRQMVRGDDLWVIGTVSNRTDQEHNFEVRLATYQIGIYEPAKLYLTVPAHGEGNVSWRISGENLSQAGKVSGYVTPLDVASDKIAEFSDALDMDLRIVPNGIEHRIELGGILKQEKTVTVNLPANRIEPNLPAEMIVPASEVTVSMRTGLKQTVEEMASDVLRYGRYGSSSAADQILVTSAAGLDGNSKDVRESLAFLSRYQQQSGGWGWWDEEASSPDITAHVLLSIARAQSAGIPVPSSLKERGVSGAKEQFNDTNLWEYRALLASAVTLADGSESSKLLDEVQSRGTNLSPYAKLLLSEALIKNGKQTDAAALTDETLKDAVIDPEIAYVPTGEHPGWTESTVETTAQALSTLVRLDRDAELQAKMAQWLATPEEAEWLSQDDKTAIVYALGEYLAKHPEPARTGNLELTVNGTDVANTNDGKSPARMSIPYALLKDGDNTITMRRTGESGEAFYSVQARVYPPAMEESHTGMRVVRRYEVQNNAGVWEDVHGPIKISQPIRCSVLVWPDDRPDGIRVIEPIPAGFEFIDSDYTGFYAREEVRDGAVVHYLKADGKPVYFRYYLRSESEGKVLALPASAMAIRRPSVQANSSAMVFEVRQ